MWDFAERIIGPWKKGGPPITYKAELLAGSMAKLRIEAEVSRGDFLRVWTSAIIGFTLLLRGIELAALGVRAVTLRSSDGVEYVRNFIRGPKKRSRSRIVPDLGRN